MLYKLIGAILITAGTAAWGISGVVRLRARAACLNALTSSFEVMSAEIGDRLTPLPELMRLLSVTSPQPVSAFYGNVCAGLTDIADVQFSEVWRLGVKGTPQLLLTQEEERQLTELGLTLGRYNAADQRASIEYTRRRFDAFAARAETERDTNSRLHAFLGVAAGLFAVIILL